MDNRRPYEPPRMTIVKNPSVRNGRRLAFLVIGLALLAIILLLSCGCTTITYKDADIEVTYRRVLTQQAVQYNPSTGLITMDVATDADPALKALEYAARISAAGATVAP